MKKLGLSLICFIVPLCLTSCGANSNNPHISKNGDLTYLSEITHDNAYIDGTFKYLNELIDSNENFIFYLTDSECSHCEEFKNKMLDYVKDTKASVVRMDISEYRPDDTIGYTKDFQDFCDAYGDYFFVNGEVYTPQIYVAKGLNMITKVPSSRYSTSAMFKGAMNDYVYLDNVMLFSDIQAYNTFYRENRKLMTILLPRGNELANNIYKESIKDIIHESKDQIALVEIDESNEADFLSYFSIGSLYQPYAIYKRGGIITNKYIFGTNIEANKEFLNRWLEK